MKFVDKFMDDFKRMGKKQLADLMLSLLSHCSPETWLKLATIAEALVDDPNNKESVRKVKRSLLEGENSQASMMFRRVMTEVSPHCLRKGARALFINGLLMSSNARDRFQRENGFRPPFTILISPTMRCNLNCIGCYAGRYRHEAGLPYEEIDRIVGEASEMGTFFIVFSGGEPLTRKDDLFRIIEKYEDLYFMFYTNGTLIDKPTAKRLYELGNAGAIISLEGFEEATDARRGKGTFKRIMQAMDNLKELGVPFGTSLTVTRKNVYEITSDEFVDFIISKGVMMAWYFLFMPVGKDPDVNLMPTAEQRDHLRRRGIEIRNSKPIFIADFWNDAPHVGGCIAGGRQYFHINANGDVEPCVFTHFAVDNIKGKTLKEILLSPFFQDIRSRQPYTDNLLRPCMIIDNPYVYREVVKKHNARPTHQGAEDVVTKSDVTSFIDKYAESVKQLYEDIWKKEYEAKYGAPQTREEVEPARAAK